MCVCLSPSPPPHSLSFSLGKIDWVILLFPPWCRSLASLGEGEAVRAVWRHTGIMIMKERAHTCTVTPEEKRGYLWRESLVKEEHTHHLNYFLSHILSYFYMDIAGKTEEGFLHYRRILSANIFFLLFAWTWRAAVSKKLKPLAVYDCYPVRRTGLHWACSVVNIWSRLSGGGLEWSIKKVTEGNKEYL